MYKRRVLAVALALSWATAAVGQENPAEREEWYLWTSDGVRHYVVELGRGDTVVALHGGFGAEHSYLLEALEPLADRFHFVLYDQRGSLRSPAPDSTITFARLVTDLDELRAELGLENLTLFAHSNGGTLAYDYLAAHPERVRGLVLTGPVAPVDSPEEVAELGADTARVRAARIAWQEALEARIADELAEEGLEGEPRASRERTHQWRIAFTACTPTASSAGES